MPGCPAQPGHSPALGGSSQRLTPPPLPAWHPPELAAAPQLEPETGMGVLIAQGMFGEEDGQIQWYGVIASTNMSRESRPRSGGPRLPPGRAGEGPGADTGRMDVGVGGCPGTGRAWGILERETGMSSNAGQPGPHCPSAPLPVARPPREAINCTWFDHYYGGRDAYLAVLLSNPFYAGPWAAPTSWPVPVGTDDCGQTRDICNGRLRPGSRYR